MTRTTNYQSLIRLFWTPGCEHVNAFSRDWAGENNWLVPPVYLISSTPRHCLPVQRWVLLLLHFRSPDVKQSFVKDFKIFEEIPQASYVLGIIKSLC